MRKKIILLLSLIILPLALLTGCNAENNEVSQNKTKNTYDTTNLVEKKENGVKFFTSLSDDWGETESQGYKLLMVKDKVTGTNISILKDKNNRLIPSSDAKWESISSENIHKMLSLPGVENIVITQTELSGKKAFKVTYQVKTIKGEQYYIRLNDEESVVVTYTEMKSAPEYQRELQHIINTIEMA